MFQVIGDEVWFQGYAVATLRNDVPPSKRAEVVEILHGVEAEPDFCAECDAKDEDIRGAEQEANEVRDDLEKAEERLHEIEEILDDPVIPEVQLARIRATIAPISEDAQA